MATKKVGYKDRVEKLKDIVSHEKIIKEHQNILKYIDLKKGIVLRKNYSQKTSKPTSFTYWNSIVEIYGCPTEFKSCFNAQTCSMKKPESCNCIILPGFNNKILEDIVNKVIEKNDIKSLVSKVQQDFNLLQEWTSLGEIITSWGCSGDKMRIV